jgi:mRNA-degrading endonuclease RelE of RelBE toxin-antitoxin system
MLDIKKNYHEDIASIDKWFSDLEDKWLFASQIKNIGRIKEWPIYRKRVWRRRIVFMVQWTTIGIFLIEIEKDTKKDYNEWLDYIKTSFKK